jgi:catechol 2,3-dioxygenase-like lactoylglutathione lyase family enzyme
MNQVVHFEIPVDDVERARGFYGTVFEWVIVPMDEADYTLVLTTPVDEKGPMENRMPIEPRRHQRGADAPFVGYTGAGRHHPGGFDRRVPQEDRGRGWERREAADLDG